MRYRELVENAGSGKVELIDPSAIGYDDPADEFLYHVTSRPNADVILRQGFRPDSPKTFSNYGFNTLGRLFFTERGGVRFWMDRIEDHLFHAHDDPPEVAVLRVPRAKLAGRLKPDPLGSEDAKTPSYFVTGPILESTEKNTGAPWDTENWWEPKRTGEGPEEYGGYGHRQDDDPEGFYHRFGVPAEVENRYSYAQCTYLAYAMNERYGWQIRAEMYRAEPTHIAHAYCVMPDGREIDILGPQDKVDSFDGGKVRDFTPKEMHDFIMTGRYPKAEKEANLVAARYAVELFIAPKVEGKKPIVENADRFTRDHTGVYRLGEWWIWPDTGGRIWSDHSKPPRVREWVVGYGDQDVNVIDEDAVFKDLASAQAYVLSKVGGIAKNAQPEFTFKLETDNYGDGVDHHTETCYRDGVAVSWLRWSSAKVPYRVVDEVQPNEAWLADLEVFDPDHRNQGLGAMHYRSWEERLPPEITRVRLYAESAAAERFWQRMGFRRDKGKRRDYTKVLDRPVMENARRVFEGKVREVPNTYGTGDVRVWENPSRDQVESLAFTHAELRGVALGPDIFVWKSEAETHDGIWLGLKGMGYEGARVDFVVDSAPDGGSFDNPENYTTRVRVGGTRALEALERHPAFVRWGFIIDYYS